MKALQQEFESFLSQLNTRLGTLSLNLNDYLVDHVGYRVTTNDEYVELGNLLKSESTLYMRAPYHGRDIYCFFLKTPLVYNDIKIYSVEFAEPGGSDTYQKGFQHIELLLTKKEEEKLSERESLKDLLFKGKFGDETYLKWPDKVAVKTRQLPLLAKYITEEGLEVTVPAS